MLNVLAVAAAVPAVGAGTGLRANLYVRQRTGASSGWAYQTRACNGATTYPTGGGNMPFPGGTKYFDFKVVRNSDYVAYDYNELGGA